MENESILGQVHRQASTSSSSPNDSDDAPAPSAPSREPRAYETSRKKSKRRKLNPFTRPQDRYAHRLAAYASEFFHSLHGHDDHWLHGASSDDRIASNDWSNEDLSCFFASLARRSHFRPDLITKDLAGRKTHVQVSAYLRQLRDVAAEYSAPPLAERTASTARQVSDRWLQREEALAQEYQRAAAGTETDVTEDIKVSTAVLFLQRQRNKHKRAGEQISVQLPKDDGSVIQVTAFSLGELGRLMCSKGRDSTKEYQAFHGSHPLPHIARKGKVDRTGRPPTIRKFKKETKTDQDQSEIPDEPHQQERAPITSSALRTRRVLLRAIELDLFLMVQHDEGTDSHCIPALSGGKPSIKYKGRRVKAATLSDSVPRKFIEQIQVVFVSDLDETVKASVPLRKGLRLLKTASENALARLLSSLTHQELSWIDSLISEDQDRDRDQHNANPGTSASPPPRRSRDVQTEEFRGYSLTGMTKDEKRKFKARIRAREAKYGVQATREMESAPRTKRSAGLGSEKKDVWNKGKSKILEPFQNLLQGLSGKERTRKENRLRAKVRALGLRKAIETELGDQEVIHVSADLQMSPEAVSQDNPHDDATPTDPTTVADSRSRRSASVVNPVHAPKGRRGDNSRFAAIGHDAVSVRTYLKKHCDSVDLFDLTTLGDFLSASTMTSCTRPDEVDSLVDQEEPLRLDLLATLPRLRDEVRDFVEKLVSDLVEDGERDFTSEAGVERGHVERILAQRTKGDDVATEGDGALSLFDATGFTSDDDEDADDSEFLDEDDSEGQASTSDEGSSDDDTDEDEIFESHIEAAQVDSVRRIWGGSSSSKSKSKEETPSLTSGFYWPPPSSRGPPRNDTDTNVDVISDDEDQELSFGIDDEEDDDDDSEAESVSRWNAIDERDRERDDGYERRAWAKWFGDASGDLQVIEKTHEGAGESAAAADVSANPSEERDDESMQGSDGGVSASESSAEDGNDDAVLSSDGE